MSRWHVAGGALQWTDLGAADPPDDDPVALGITGYDGSEARIIVGGTDLAVPIEASPAAGLAVYDTDVVCDNLVLGAP